MKIVEKIRGRRSRLNRRRAFTLIEMLAALALAMILLYILFQIFTTVGRAMTISNARSEIHANARAILRIIHQEISGAFLDTSQDADGDTDADYFIKDYGQIVDQSTAVKKASFSNASTQVTGNNTTWQGLVQRADSILGPDGEWYMISAVVSNTELTLARPYEGTTASTADYSIGTPFLKFLASSAVGSNSALNEVAYWLDTSDLQKRILRRHLGPNPFDASDTDSFCGTITGVGATTLTDNTQDWDTNQWVDMTVVVGGQRRLVVSNNSDTLTVTPAWNPLPDAGEKYKIISPFRTILGENILGFNVEYSDGNFDSGTITGKTATSLTDTPQSWDADEWVGKIVIAGGQRRAVVSNDSNTLTITPAWNPEPDNGTLYTIEEFADGAYTAEEKRLTPAVRITLRVRDRRGRLSQGEEFVEIIAIKGRE